EDSEAQYCAKLHPPRMQFDCTGSVQSPPVVHGVAQKFHCMGPAEQVMQICPLRQRGASAPNPQGCASYMATSTALGASVAMSRPPMSADASVTGTSPDIGPLAAAHPVGARAASVVAASKSFFIDDPPRERPAVSASHEVTPDVATLLDALVSHTA